MEAIELALKYGALIEKGGVVVLLFLVIGVLAWDYARLRKELRKAYVQRDRAVLSLVKCKTVLESRQIPVDLSDIRDLIPNGT